MHLSYHSVFNLKMQTHKGKIKGKIGKRVIKISLNSSKFVTDLK